jgi:fluoride exporter
VAKRGGVKVFVLLAVFIGGALGTTLRYLSMLLIDETGFPIATFTVNMLGTFGLVIFYTLALNAFHFREEIKGFVATGFFGALTTFSAFAFEISIFITNEKYVLAAMYLILSYSCGLLLAVFGYQLTNNFTVKVLKK